MKKIVALLLSTLMLLTSAAALEYDSGVSQADQTASIENPIEPQAEQTVWYTRHYNGKRQKRLWSITYRRWLTDWIDVD